MTTAQRFEIKCGTCGYWMPAAEGTLDAAALTGNVVQCRKCLQRTTCTASNTRARADGGATA
jgi:hypothetical protein